MNPLDLKINLKTLLLSLGGVSTLLLLVLLVAEVLVLNQIRETQNRQHETRAVLDLAIKADDRLRDAVKLFYDAGMTGRHEVTVQAKEALDASKALLISSLLAGGDLDIDIVSEKLDHFFEVGEEMVQIYLIEGQVDGNVLLSQPDDGFEVLADELQALMVGHMSYVSSLADLARDQLAAAEGQGRIVLLSITVLLMLAIPAAFFLLYQKLMGSVHRIMDTVSRIVDEGDYDARCMLDSGDELQMLADAFDHLLDERVGQYAIIEKENNAINNSIINILEATGKLANRDLRINAPVAEDVTGAISDSLNAAAHDMAEVLGEVRTISEQVGNISNTVDEQSTKVYGTAQKNLDTVDKTLKELQQASHSMVKVMGLANVCYKVSGAASQSTSRALESVASTTEGMGRIRSGIQETSKRIKGLGERSQEISGIIGIIKDITERTHVLALNARIQASTAGEAGKGFSVVAEEVKLLAESSRTATTQIAELIQNIQIETNDTIATMEQTVEEVVSGTELSEKAFSQMQETRKTTQRLANAVKQIASSSKLQVELNKEISVHADELRISALSTREGMESQRWHADKLKKLSKKLILSVGEFELPETT